MAKKTLFFKRNPKDMLGAFCCFLNLCCYLKTCMPMQYQWYERIVIGGVIGNIIGTLLSIMLVRCFQAGIRERYIQFSVINLLISNHRDNGRRIYYFNIATFIIFLIDMFCINVDILWQMARYIRYIFFDGYDFFNMKWK